MGTRGANRACLAVLTWAGEVSAVSRDAMHDSRLARASSVIDDWDEEFDRGKVRLRGGLVLADWSQAPGSGAAWRRKCGHDRAPVPSRSCPFASEGGGRSRGPREA